LLQAALPLAGDADEAARALEQAGQTLRRKGLLPLGGAGERSLEGLTDPLPDLLARYGELLRTWSQPIAEPLHLSRRWGELLLDDWLGGLQADARGRRAYLVPVGRALCQGNSPRWKLFLAPWLAHLAAAAAEVPLTTLVVGTDRTLEPPHLDPLQAQAALDALLESWLEGMGRPLPVALKTACAYLDRQSLEAARTAYEGGDYANAPPGEVAWCAYLSRCYPDFAALSAGEEFPHWAERLYGQLHAQLSAALNCKEQAS
jgi:exodeoxyribonuclease V gamma subunit